ncbi:MAG: hypothetical protein H6925_02180 [Holosporaceae bacterium]|nr:MAG: hypothetical protein H6925_02180 [Holosporaceae bacterium]
MDPKTYTSCIKDLNLQETFFIVISKSGNTAETLIQFLSTLENVKKKKLMPVQFRTILLSLLKIKNHPYVS